jgi:4-amino-4-deoxy-L-arabinose transferase-like glycosyltransferase
MVPTIMSQPPEKRLGIALLCIVLLVGAFLRIYPSAGTKYPGVDEMYYRHGVMFLVHNGFTSYPSLIRNYVKVQPTLPVAVIPPTRVTLIAAGFLWHQIFNSVPVISLRAVACSAGVLTLLISALFLYRGAGLPAAIAVSALLSCAPIQIQLAQRAYVDGVFAFTAILTLWLLWENMRGTSSLKWLVPYGASIALMVVTKENAAFIFVGILSILACNRWLKIGQVGLNLVITTFVGALAGVATLIIASGGPATLIQVFQASISKTYATPYVIQTGDGPWFRYILDLIAMSPLVTVLALAALGRLSFQEAISRYFVLFLAVTYLLMSNLRYGISLRYTAIWDLPLRYLAFTQIVLMAVSIPTRYRTIFIPVAVAVVCAVDLSHYYFFFVQNGTYDPTATEILRQLNIVK